MKAKLKPSGIPSATRAERHGGNRPRQILVVVGQSGMGDAVEALPVFEMIHRFWPDVYLCAGYFREPQKAILETSPHVSRTIRLSGGVRYARRALKAFFFNLKATHGLDTVLFLYKNNHITWPVRVAARLAGAQVLYRHGYEYLEEGRNTYSDFPEHVFFQIVASNLLLGLPLTRVIKPALRLSDEDHQFATGFFSRTGLGGRPVVVINTQSEGVGSLPDWGISKYAQVANALVDFGADVIFNGGGQHQVEQFKSVAQVLRDRVALLEMPNPRQLAAVFARTDLYIGAGHGAACLAMAMGTPSLTLVGPGEHGYPGQERIGPPWWPRGPEHKVISKVDWCRKEMGARCTCQPEKPGALKRLMKFFGLWEPWRMVRKQIQKLLGIRRHAAAEPYPLCFEAITVEEIVGQAKTHLSLRKQNG